MPVEGILLHYEYIREVVVEKLVLANMQRVFNFVQLYNGIGVIRGLSPEEMEEAFQKRLEQIKSKTA